MYVTLNHFRALIITLKEKNIAVKVKTHTGWSNNYLNIVGLITATIDHEKIIGGVVLSNQTETEGILINNIASISCFELEKNCGQYKAHKIYLLQDNVAELTPTASADFDV